MITDRDSKRRVVKGNVPWNRRVASGQREMTTFGERKIINGQQVKAVANCGPEGYYGYLRFARVCRLAYKLKGI